MKDPFKVSLPVLTIASTPFFFSLNRTKKRVNLLIVDSVFTGVSLVMI